MNGWIDTNYEAYEISGLMYEKYDAYQYGERGEGGEYKPQVSF